MYYIISTHIQNSPRRLSFQMRYASNSDVDLLYLRARCLFAMGDVENALKSLAMAVRSDPDNTQVWIEYIVSSTGQRFLASLLVSSLHLSSPLLTSLLLSSPHLSSSHLTSPLLTSPHLSSPLLSSPFDLTPPLHPMILS